MTNEPNNTEKRKKYIEDRAEKTAQSVYRLIESCTKDDTHDDCACLFSAVDWIKKDVLMLMAQYEDTLRKREEQIKELTAQNARVAAVAKLARKVLDCLYEFCEKNCSGAGACGEYTELLEDALSALPASSPQEEGVKCRKCGNRYLTAICDCEARQESEEELTVSLTDAIECEPECPDEMPEQMWQAIKNDKDAVSEAIRIAVRQTKENILKRILEALRGRGKGSA